MGTAGLNMTVAAVGWPFNKIQEWIEGIVTDFINGVVSLVELAFAHNGKIMEDGLMDQTFRATQGVALILILLLSLKHILNVYVLETDGDADSDPLQVLVRNSIAALVISAGGLIMDLAVKWSSDLCSFITGASTYSISFEGIVFALEFNFISRGWFTLAFAFVFVVIMFLYGFVALIRGVELGVMKILLPIMACDITSVRQEKWNAFLASLIVVSFGYIIQVVLLKLAITYAVQSDMMSLLTSLVCLFFGLKTPRWLEKYAYSSGLKDTARSGMYMGMMIGRMI